MHVSKTTNKISAYLLAAVIIIAAALSPMAASAETTKTLYGTGSDDDVNIVKVLDMSLNKCGVSMSPATIKAFLEYWWASVREDLNTCIGNADMSITTTRDFIDYCYSVLQNPTTDSAFKVPQLALKYVVFCERMSGKSLADFKQLLTQEGTFRDFLLSNVKDADGNVADRLDNKIQRYQIDKSLVNMTRQAVDAYIEEYEGYWLVPTLTYKDISPTQFITKECYDQAYDFLKNKLGDEFVFLLFNGISTGKFDSVVLMDGLNIVNTSYSRLDILQFDTNLYDDNWSRFDNPYLWSFSDNIDNFPNTDGCGRFSSYLKRFYFFADGEVVHNTYYIPFTNDGRFFKIWKSLDAFKSYSIGKSNVYYSSGYGSYDESKDNGVSFTGAYYNGDYSHDTIQNSIDNSQTIDESTVNNIVNNYITNNFYGDSSGSGGSGSGSGSDGWWDIGSGISSFIEGVASLLDFILKLLGDLVGLLGNFLTSVLDVLSSLTALGQGFGDFLGATFSFLPEECISLIISSIAAMCVVGVVRAFLK